MRLRPLAAIGASLSALSLLGAFPGSSQAAPQTSLPDGQLTIATTGPPAESLSETVPFDTGTQEFSVATSGQIDGLDVSFTAMGDPDPAISYQLVVDSNAAATRDVFLLFRIPIAPLAEIDTASATLDVNLVDANGGGASLLLVDPNPIQEAKVLVQSNGGPPVAVSLRVPLGDSDILAPGPLNLNAGPIAGPTPQPFGDEFSSLEVRANFEISPGDRVTLDGTVTVVPEPGAALALLVLAPLAGLAARRVRRSSNKA